LCELFDAKLLPRPRWYWDWRAETRAPASPFIVDDKTVTKANFWFSLRVKGRNYSAPKLSLAIIEKK